MAAYTIAEAARELNVSTQQLRRLVKAGRLSAFNVGVGVNKSLRINEGEIVRFTQGDRPQPPAAPLPRPYKTRESSGAAKVSFRDRLAAIREVPHAKKD